MEKQKGLNHAANDLFFAYFSQDKKDHFINCKLAGIFQFFRKLRVSLAILEQTDQRDIYVVYEKLRLFKRLGDRESYDALESGLNEKIIKQTSRKLQDKLRVIRERKFLLPPVQGSIYRVGIFSTKNGDEIIAEDGVAYPVVTDNPDLNSRVRDGWKVFFALYDIEGRLWANFVEPWFDSIDDLSKLR